MIERVVCCLLCLGLLAGSPVGAKGVAAAALETGTVSSPDLEEILQRVEERYGVEGFTASFLQISTIRALDITDHAKGRIFVKRPGMMRWEYQTPEPQVIISDGSQLWIYRPEDNQVLVGRAPSFFGDGKGGSFLSDIGKMREKFTITVEPAPEQDDHLLRLTPKENSPDIEEIYLTVSWATFRIEEIVTVNPYGDRTRISLVDQRFDQPIDKEIFRFDVPEGVEVLQLEESP